MSRPVRYLQGSATAGHTMVTQLSFSGGDIRAALQITDRWSAADGWSVTDQGRSGWGAEWSATDQGHSRWGADVWSATEQWASCWGSDGWSAAAQQHWEAGAGRVQDGVVSGVA